MDGIVRVRTIAFTPDRMPTQRRIRLGYEGDNLVERLEFDLPEIAAGQTATLMITGADAVTLDRTDDGRYAVDLTRDMIGPDGEREAHVRIDGTGEKVWQSAPMRLVTGALPDVEEEIEKVYPTAVGQMLTAMVEHSGEMTAQEERVEQAAQRAEEAAERAEAGGGGGGSGGSAVEIDATLTQEGKAADAKATGEAIGKLSKEMAENDIPKIFYDGALPQTKDDAVMKFRLISQSVDVDCYCETKAQGNSSMNWPKKNQTTKLYADEACEDKLKLNFKNWGAQSKYCLKANWIDLTHARNIVSARLWGDVVRSRANYAELPELLRTSPNVGAIDGFPIKVYAGGVYQGRYTLNIPKDAWMANMDKKNPNHCILCGENFASGWFRAPAVIDGSDWSDEVHDTVPESIKTRWNEVISFVMHSTDEEFKVNLGNYFDVDSLIDYHIYGIASGGLDAYGKNQIYMTYDGQKWIASMYDMDSTWGLWWTGESFVSTNYDVLEYHDPAGDKGNLLYIRLEKLFYEELAQRWAELKDGALSIANIINRFERFVDIAPAALVAEDYAETTANGAFVGIPSKDTNNIQQIRAYAVARRAYANTYIKNLQPAIGSGNLIHHFDADSFAASGWLDKVNENFVLDVFGEPVVDGDTVRFDSTSYATLNTPFELADVDTTVAVKVSLPDQNAEVWFAGFPQIASGCACGLKNGEIQFGMGNTNGSAEIGGQYVKVADWTDSGSHIVALKYLVETKKLHVYYDGLMVATFVLKLPIASVIKNLYINNEAAHVRNAMGIDYIKIWEKALADEEIAALE